MTGTSFFVTMYVKVESDINERLGTDMFTNANELMNYVAEKCRERGLLTITPYKDFTCQFTTMTPHTVSINDYHTGKQLCWDEDRFNDGKCVCGYVNGKCMLVEQTCKHNGTKQNVHVQFTYINWKNSSGSGDKERYPRIKVNMNLTDKTIDKKIDNAIDMYFQFLTDKSI